MANPSGERPPKPRLPQLYRVASRILVECLENKTSAKSLVCRSHYRIKGALHRLVHETLVNLSVLDALIESVLLASYPNFERPIARVLVCELLFGTGSLPSGTGKVEIVNSLRPEFERKLSEIEHAYPTAGYKEAVPRYARVNTLRTTVDDAAQMLDEAGFEYVESRGVTYKQYLNQVRLLDEYQYLRDPHIPELLLFHSEQRTFSELTAGRELMLQTKSSCLAALALSPPPGSIVLDACAAPGMKTTHLAALMEDKGKLIAVEKSKERVQSLRQIVATAGVTCAEILCADFTSIDPLKPPYSEVEYLLLDPSCSGSGMPKREVEGTNDKSERLQSLSNLQCTLLKHALSFPSVQRVVYSTCSIFTKENEDVIADVLGSKIGERFKLVSGLPGWPRRSKLEPKMLRCDLRKDLCTGFFVAVLERNDT